MSQFKSGSVVSLEPSMARPVGLSAHPSSPATDDANIHIRIISSPASVLPDCLINSTNIGHESYRMHRQRFALLKRASGFDLFVFGVWSDYRLPSESAESESTMPVMDSEMSNRVGTKARARTMCPIFVLTVIPDDKV